MTQRGTVGGTVGLLSEGRRWDLQGMRAVAVLSVFSNHLFNWPSGGFVGVDVFFVLSGFFISSLLIRERQNTGRLSFEDFYIRRVKRIVPSALLVLAVTAMGSQFLFPAVRAKDTLLDALYASVFAANLRFQAVGADYFQQGEPPSPLQHYWSLSIEEQFYFVWPAVLVVIFALTRRLRRSGYPWARQWGLFGAMFIVVAASFHWAMYLSVHDANRAYFSTFTRVWELGVGALVAIAGPWLMNIPTAIRPGLAYLGVVGVGVSLFWIDPSLQFPAPWAALPVLSTALIIVSFHGAEVRGMLPLTNPVMRWLGDTSYTLYLWHWPIIILLLAVMPRSPLYYGIVLVAAFALTAVTYRFYENPIRKSDWLLEYRWISVSTWGVIGGLAAAAVIVVIIGLQRPETQIDYVSQDSPVSQNTQVKVDPCFGAPAMTTAGCVMRNPDMPLKPSIDYAAKDVQGQDKCERAKDQPHVKSCTYGYHGDDAVRIALIGDSHAAAMLPALWPLLGNNHWQLTTYLGDGCQWRANPENGCPIGEIQQQLLAHPYKLVLTTSLRRYGGDVADFQQMWIPVAAVSRIAAIADNPSVNEDSIACLTRVNITDRTGECGTSRQEGFAQPDPLISAASIPNATVIDLSPYYCTADRCPTVIGNVIVYRDTRAHITATFAKTLAPPLEDAIRRALS